MSFRRTKFNSRFFSVCYFKCENHRQMDNNRLRKQLNRNLRCLWSLRNINRIPTDNFRCNSFRFVALCFRDKIAVIQLKFADASDCYDLYNKYNIRTSGTYYIFPPGFGQIFVYCEMETDGGGWTVFQRFLTLEMQKCTLFCHFLDEVDGSLSFSDKKWNDYKNGFNNGLTNSLWLGNENIHALSTKDTNVELRIDIWRDRNPASTNQDVYLYGKYTSFSVSNIVSLH